MEVRLSSTQAVKALPNPFIRLAKVNRTVPALYPILYPLFLSRHGKP
jgi:hypothetical protein